jgi:hypothetical protein
MNRLAGVAILGLSLLVTASSAAAQGRIYKWVDAQGRIHFSDTPTGNAESVDEALPPASNFGTQPEPAARPLASTEPPADTVTPPPATATPPSTEGNEPAAADNEPATADNEPAAAGSEPATAEPDAGGELGVGEGGPLATGEEGSSPAAQASAELLETGEADDSVSDELEGGESFDEEEAGEEGAE